MKTVEPHVLVVGNGRLASFLRAYLQTADAQHGGCSLSWSVWDRSQPTSFHAAVEAGLPTHIWLCISDRSLTDFIANNHADLVDRTVVHFSGSTGTLAIGDIKAYPAHPLMAFPASLSSASFENLLGTFRVAPFAVSEQMPNLDDLLPGFRNRTFIVDDAKRPLYHAYCSIAGNLTVLLWEEIEYRWRETLGLKLELLAPFRNQILQSLAVEREESILTGPMTRGDSQTLERQKQALIENADPELAATIDAAEALFKTRSRNRTQRPSRTEEVIHEEHL